MLIIKQNGTETPYASEAAYIAAHCTAGVTPAPSPGNTRIRRQRRRETALRFYFKMIRSGSDQWHRIAEIHTKAPKLTERIAKECGFPNLLSAIASAEAGGKFITTKYTNHTKTNMPNAQDQPERAEHAIG